jgi:hypothetical protein
MTAQGGDDMLIRLAIAAMLSFMATACAQQPSVEQSVDPTFRLAVATPAYPNQGPVVAIDKGHSNFHTAGGRYAPFAGLLRADGYRVRSIGERFDANSLRGIDVLVIANALGKPDAAPAFTSTEASAVETWVAQGGSLLLIADHTPFGSAAQILAAQFNVDMGKGYAVVSQRGKFRANIEFAGDMLGEHPILAGRDPNETIHRVKSFTGQSLSLPVGATALLKLPEGSLEAVDEATLDKFQQGEKVSLAQAGGRAQGIALTHGRGRVVIMGEAAMFTAQVIHQPGKPDDHFGMSVPGFDDRQFALNILHWLSRLLP